MQPQDWVMYETNDEDDGPRYWQIRDSFPEDLQSTQYSVAVVIEWTYSDDGLPEPKTLSDMHEFEEKIGHLNTKAGNSLLVHIIRGSGVSELCYYVLDHDLFMTELNDALSGQPHYPIEIEFMNDPNWAYRRSILENFAQ